MKPTLLILAAGIGSRYGGLKQIDPVGPKGETIIDYSIYDAIKAGFEKIVYVIRKDIEKAFKEAFDHKYRNHVEIDYAYQENDLPPGYPATVERQKPWGTAHAVMAAKDQIQEPFAVINADDFYGAEAYQSTIKFFQEIPSEINGMENYALVGYKLENTLSDFGSVSRGVGEDNDQGDLVTINERHGVEKTPEGIFYTDAKGNKSKINSESVSMNFWAFYPSIFQEMEFQFRKFVAGNSQNPKAEFLIPAVIDLMIKQGKAKVKVLKTSAQWYGVTYQEDKPKVTAAMQSLVEQGVYPSPLW